MSSSRTGFVVLYRWRVDAEAEESFIRAWSRLTELIRTHQGGRGSRLHRGADGLLYGYAQWPDRTSWEAEWQLPPEADALLAAMSEATLDRLEPILLTPIADLLTAEPSDAE